MLDGVGSLVTGGEGRVAEGSGREVVGSVVAGRAVVGMLGPGAEVVGVARVGDAVLGRVGVPVGAAPPGEVEFGRVVADGAPVTGGAVDPGVVLDGPPVVDDVLIVGVVAGSGVPVAVLSRVVGEAGVEDAVGVESAGADVAVDGVVLLGEFGPGVSVGAGASVAGTVCTDCCAWYA